MPMNDRWLQQDRWAMEDSPMQDRWGREDSPMQERWGQEDLLAQESWNDNRTSLAVPVGDSHYHTFTMDRRNGRDARGGQPGGQWG